MIEPDATAALRDYLDALADVEPGGDEVPCMLNLVEARALVRYIDEQASMIAGLQIVMENMATRHVYFGRVGSDERRHVDWCGACTHEIVTDLRALDPIDYDADADVFVCFFCEVGMPTDPKIPFGPERHRPACLWRRAHERPTVAE